MSLFAARTLLFTSEGFKMPNTSMERKIDSIPAAKEKLDQRLEKIDNRMESIEKRVNDIENGFKEEIQLLHSQVEDKA